MYSRTLSPSDSYSYFLFGARATGKTTLLNKIYCEENSMYFDLLDINIEDRLARDPKLFINTISDLDKNIRYIIVDEIQKLPRLLDLIHQYMNKNKDRFVFVLTGSSARKLKRGGANLLAGRAFNYNLFPLTFLELGTDFNLMSYINYGGLPEIHNLKNESEKIKYLITYSQLYLKEEVWNEHLIRNIDPFRKFLEVAAQQNGELINYSKIAKQIGVDTKSVQNYFQIFEDTNIGFLLEPYHTSLRKRIVLAPKFYYFDPGVLRALQNNLNSKVLEQTYGFGKYFEHFIICQIQYLSHYYEKNFEFFFLRTDKGAEIDLIIKSGKEFYLIEIKSTLEVSINDVKNLNMFHKEWKNSKAICLSRDPINRVENEISFYHWETGIKKIIG